jgi:hypothetical protein
MSLTLRGAGARIAVREPLSFRLIRAWRPNASQTLMKFTTYRSTPGLDRFPRSERFTVYRSAHVRLLASDPSYRRQRLIYFLSFISIAFIPTAAWWGRSVLGSLLAASITAVAIISMLLLAFRQQKLMNQHIATILPR